ncbi:MAG: long-chain fatty acid--CoA ligase, partial [Methanobacterium sp.]
GHITSEGSLVITGRKKEVIVNSYGKTINPLKIEGMLKNIPGIDEAMVIGDVKPYCSAFLWTESTELNFAKLDDAIRETNIRLSRPEEIKEWVILNNDLSIGVDLTANLKLKREAIIKRYKAVVDFIYGSGLEPDNILHIGHIEVQS